MPLREEIRYFFNKLFPPGEKRDELYVNMSMTQKIFMNFIGTIFCLCTLLPKKRPRMLTVQNANGKLWRWLYHLPEVPDNSPLSLPFFLFVTSAQFRFY